MSETDPIIDPIPTPVVVQPTKPGWKTTEFWLTLATSLIGAFMASGLIQPGTKFDKAIGFAVLVLSKLGYDVSRGLAKRVSSTVIVTQQTPKL